MSICGVYAIVNRVNGKQYVGSSRNVKARWATHRRELTRRTHRNEHLTRAWHLYGCESFDFILLHQVPEDELLPVEQVYLDACALRPDEYYNLNYEARGGRPSPEVLVKISAKLKGRTLSEEHRKRIGLANTGREYSADTRAKIGAATAKRRHTEDTKQRIRLASVGRRASDETRARISASNKGRHTHHGEENPKYDHTGYLFQQRTTGEGFLGTQWQFRRWAGVPAGNLSGMLRGRLRHVAGWEIIAREGH